MIGTYVLLTIATLVANCAIGCVHPSNSNPQNESSWQEEFGLSERKLVPTGRNKYFILEPGFQIVLEGKTGFFGMNYEELAITVLDETKTVNGVVTRVVEEREWKNDELIEVSRNFFAIDEQTLDIFYFGEDVDMYKDDKVVSHKGAWIAGMNNARAGLMIPGEPKLGMKYYQEIAPGVAMDRAEIVDLDEELETPAGTFSKCLKTKEGTALNFFEREFKTYSPDIGLIQDANLLLTKYGFIEKNESN